MNWRNYRIHKVSFSTYYFSYNLIVKWCSIYCALFYHFCLDYSQYNIFSLFHVYYVIFHNIKLYLTLLFIHATFSCSNPRKSCYVSFIISDIQDQKDSGKLMNSSKLAGLIRQESSLIIVHYMESVILQKKDVLSVKGKYFHVSFLK